MALADTSTKVRIWLLLLLTSLPAVGLSIYTALEERAETRERVHKELAAFARMEAKRVPGLYFIREVVDVTGHLGGFNFQRAWASGFVAGHSV